MNAWWLPALGETESDDALWFVESKGLFVAKQIHDCRKEMLLEGLGASHVQKVVKDFHFTTSTAETSYVLLSVE